MVHIIFSSPQLVQKTVKAKVGDSLLSIAQDQGYDLEGTCEGSLACSTCHVIVSPHWYNKLPFPSEEELDLLDLVPNLTMTSRLSCQIRIEEDYDGLEVQIPSYSFNHSSKV